MLHGGGNVLLLVMENSKGIPFIKLISIICRRTAHSDASHLQLNIHNCPRLALITSPAFLASRANAAGQGVFLFFRTHRYTPPLRYLRAYNPYFFLARGAGKSVFEIRMVFGAS